MIVEKFGTDLTTGQEYLNDIDEITSMISEDIEQRLRPRNRKERRAIAKRAGKKGRQQLNLITETARKLNYIDLIQKLRKLNKEKEENGETTIEDD